MADENPLWKLRSWFTVDEAAERISAATGATVTAADVLRLALDDYLRLSVKLPIGTEVRCFDYGAQEFSTTVTRRIGGICELPMLDAGRVEIESWYHRLRGFSPIPRERTEGAVVGRKDEAYQLLPQNPGSENSASPCSALPQGCVVVVRATAVEEFLDHARRSADQSTSDRERPFGERERGTLLTVIAALAKAANIDLTTPSKAGAAIEALTTELGARVSGRTIEEHLKRIPDVLERRAKDSL